MKKTRTPHIIDWEKAESLTVAEMERMTGRRQRSSGHTRLTKQALAVNQFMEFIRQNDLYGHAKPVLTYTNPDSAASYAARLRRARAVADAVAEGLTKEQAQISNTDWGMRTLELHDGEYLYATHMRNNNGTADVYIALCLKEEGEPLG
jgi:hypothetical protein